MELFIKEGKRKCLECKKILDLSKDKFVLLATCNMLEPDKHKEEYVFFHFPCWVKYFNDRVNNKSAIQVKAMQDQALNVFNSPVLKDILETVKGSELLGKMLNTNIPVVSFPKINEEKKDGEKRKARKRIKKW